MSFILLHLVAFRVMNTQ